MSKICEKSLIYKYRHRAMLIVLVIVQTIFLVIVIIMKVSEQLIVLLLLLVIKKQEVWTELLIHSHRWWSTRTTHWARPRRTFTRRKKAKITILIIIKVANKEWVLIIVLRRRVADVHWPCLRYYSATLPHHRITNNAPSTVWIMRCAFYTHYHHTHTL